jgi:hypothetical protein
MNNMPQMEPVTHTTVSRLRYGSNDTTNRMPAPHKAQLDLDQTRLSTDVRIALCSTV